MAMGREAEANEHLIIIANPIIHVRKDTDTDLNPVYGPSVTVQFGDISALVQEVSFN
jgi:hypothetical protein